MEWWKRWDVWFSGAGIFVIAVIGNAIVKYRASRKSPVASQPSEVVPAPRRFSAITPAQIHKAIESAPPLQQKGVAKTYVGLWVNWEARLVNAWEPDHDPGNVHLMLNQGNRWGDQISCTVKAADHLELMHMGRGALIGVIGRIEAAANGSVSLVDAELSFPRDETKRIEPTLTPALKLEAPSESTLLPEQIKILQTLSDYEDLIGDATVPMDKLRTQCKLTSTEFKYHSEQLKQAKLIYVTHLPDGPHYQNSPAGAGWLIKNSAVTEQRPATPANADVLTERLLNRVPALRNLVRRPVTIFTVQGEKSDKLASEIAGYLRSHGYSVTMAGAPYNVHLSSPSGVSITERGNQYEIVVHDR